MRSLHRRSLSISGISVEEGVRSMPVVRGWNRCSSSFSSLVTDFIPPSPALRTTAY